jgi:IclR family transcriptional regulator, mhp operon transcriptional activator
VYLAFCPDNERRAILDMLDHSPASEDQFDARRLAALLRRIRVSGHALQDREINPRTSGISVPICGTRVLGSVSMIWIASALTLDEAAQRYHEPLQTLAARIADNAERRHATSETQS